MVRQGLFLQFLLDLQYFFINTTLYYTHGLKYGLQYGRTSILCWILRECIPVQDCGLHFSFFLFFFPDLRGFVNLKWRSYLNALTEIVC